MTSSGLGIHAGARQEVITLLTRKRDRNLQSVSANSGLDEKSRKKIIRQLVSSYQRMVRQTLQNLY